MKRAFKYALSFILASGTSSVVSCEQPPVPCTCGRGDFAAVYTLVQGTGDCSTFKSEILGMNAYSPESGGPNSGTIADWNQNFIAIGAERLGWLTDRGKESTVVDPNPAHKPYALGDFPREPSGDFCTIPAMKTTAEVDLPMIPEVPDNPSTPDPDSKPAVEATKLAYKWSNVNFLVTPAYLGTQMAGDVEITKNACTATYKVKAVYPARECEKQAAGPDGRPMRTQQPDPELCFPVAQPDKGIFSGSGISPDFPVACVEFDPAPGASAKRFYCMITKDVPAVN